MGQSSPDPRSSRSDSDPDPEREDPRPSTTGVATDSSGCVGVLSRPAEDSTCSSLALSSGQSRQKSALILLSSWATSSGLCVCLASNVCGMLWGVVNMM